MKQPQVPEAKSLELTDAEKQAIEEQRKLEAKIKACSEEINEVLNKHGMTLDVLLNPQIVVKPVR